jgi:hypothetical protein
LLASGETVQGLASLEVALQANDTLYSAYSNMSDVFALVERSETTVRPLID